MRKSRLFCICAAISAVLLATGCGSGSKAPAQEGQTGTAASAVTPTLMATDTPATTPTPTPIMWWDRGDFVRPLQFSVPIDSYVAKIPDQPFEDEEIMAHRHSLFAYDDDLQRLKEGEWIWEEVFDGSEVTTTLLEGVTAPYTIDGPETPTMQAYEVTERWQDPDSTTAITITLRAGLAEKDFPNRNEEADWEEDSPWADIFAAADPPDRIAWGYDLDRGYTRNYYIARVLELVSGQDLPEDTSTLTVSGPLTCTIGFPSAFYTPYSEYIPYVRMQYIEGDDRRNRHLGQWRSTNGHTEHQVPWLYCG